MIGHGGVLGKIGVTVNWLLIQGEVLSFYKV